MGLWWKFRILRVQTTEQIRKLIGKIQVKLIKVTPSYGTQSEEILLSPTKSTQIHKLWHRILHKKKNFVKLLNTSKLQAVNFLETQQLQQLETSRTEVLNNIMLQEYQILTHKFFPSEQLANFISVQVAQSGKHAKGRRYSLEFKIRYLFYTQKQVKWARSEPWDLFFSSLPNQVF